MDFISCADRDGFRKSSHNYVNNLVNTDKGPMSKKLWSFIKNQRCDYCGVAPLEECGITYSKRQEKANILNRFFASVFTQDDSSSPVMELALDGECSRF